MKIFSKIQHTPTIILRQFFCLIIAFIFGIGTTFILIGCASTEPKKHTQIERTVNHLPSPDPKIIKYEEDSAPKSLFLKNSHINIYIKNKTIIERFAKEYRISSPFIFSLISEVSISIKNEFYSMFIKTEDIVFFQKKIAMKHFGATALDIEERFWKKTYTNGETSYFDIGYKNFIVFSNIPLTKNIIVWEWKEPVLIQNYSSKNTIQAWMWSDTKTMINNNTLEGITFNWGALIITEYPQEIYKDITTTLLFNYVGNKQAHTTVKLLVPLLLESMGRFDIMASLPNVTLGNNTIILEHLLLNRTSFLKYFSQNLYSNENTE